MVSWEGAAEQPVLDVMRSQAARDMQAFVLSLPENARARFTPLVEEGDVTVTVISVAERENVDLIVLGTHGRTGLSHLLLGSVAEKLLRRAPCPVLTVRIPDRQS
jgi:nucleotide-binding universal stress UspA family protein